MGSSLTRSALDARFVDLVLFTSIGVWPWLLLVSAGVALWAWKIVLMCQVIALPFSILGWAGGFRLGMRHGWTPPRSAMLAGWAGLVAGTAGLALVGLMAVGDGRFLTAGILAFPALAVLVTVGVLWLYRPATWPPQTGARIGGA